MLRNVEVAGEIERRLKATHLSADQILARLSEMARANIGEFIDDDGRVNIKAVLANGHLVKKYKAANLDSGGEIELHDCQRALYTIGRMLGVFSDTVTTPRAVSQFFESLDEALVKFVPAENRAAMVEFLRQRVTGGRKS